MNQVPILDTHYWLWWVLGDPQLKIAEREHLDGMAADDRPFLCDISLWEVALLHERGRLELDGTLDQFLEIAVSPAAVRIVPISRNIVVEMNKLPSSFHRDPADRLIVSSARVLGAPIATRDIRIRRSRLARIWKP